MKPAIDLTRHFLATILYRFRAATSQAQPGFEDFDPGSGTRTPVEIVRHMTRVLMFARRSLGEPPESAETSPVSFEDEVARFDEAIEHLDLAFKQYSAKDDLLLKKILQGPLSDVMTHIGQLAMLSRMSGAPVPGQDFSAARIESITLG